MQHPGWILVAIGLAIAAVGVLWLIGPPLSWLGKLPGDIAVEGKGFRFFFPLTTCVVLSVVATVVLWLVRMLSK